MLGVIRSSERWLPGYVGDRIARVRQGPPSRISMVLADHFEPFWATSDEDIAARRVAQWTRRWPEIASSIATAHGVLPKYTFFYAEEEYRPHLIDMLVPLVEAEIADVEVHIHHDGEGEQNFIDRLSAFTEILHSRHGLLRKQGGRVVFGFIHGNWALDNSLPNGKDCGLNNELHLLKMLGCYADFTLPAGNPAAQTSIVNTIYWAVDDLARPRSHDSGIRHAPGAGVQGDLLMIPGPLGIRWKDRRLPRIERGEIAGYDMPTPYRFRRWIDLAPRVGAESVIKLYTHGAQERNSEALLGGGLLALYNHAAAEAGRLGAELRCATPFDVYQTLMGEVASEPHCASSGEQRLLH